MPAITPALTTPLQRVCARYVCAVDYLRPKTWRLYCRLPRSVHGLYVWAEDHQRATRFTVQVEPSSGRLGKEDLLGLLAALEQYVGADRVTEEDDCALDAIGLLRTYVAEEC